MLILSPSVIIQQETYWTSQHHTGPLAQYTDDTVLIRAEKQDVAGRLEAWINT